MAASQPLSDRVVRVWTASPQGFSDDEERRLRTWLDDAELVRLNAFRFERDRRVYLAAHALLRWALARVFPAGEAVWRFTAGAQGRPEIATPVEARALRFSLSHTRGRVAVAVTSIGAVGLDVEDAERELESAALARRFFSPKENEDILAAPARERRLRFFAYWTMKEAYLKALGTGLSTPLDSFRLERFGTSFRLAAPASDAAAWQFELLQCGPEHVLSLALNSARPFKLECAEIDLAGIAAA